MNYNLINCWVKPGHVTLTSVGMGVFYRELINLKHIGLHEIIFCFITLITLVLIVITVLFLSSLKQFYTFIILTSLPFNLYFLNPTLNVQRILKVTYFSDFGISGSWESLLKYNKFVAKQSWKSGTYTTTLNGRV